MKDRGSWPGSAIFSQLNIAWCIAGAVCVPLVLGASGGRGPSLGRLFPEKRAMLREKAGSVDTVFVGSSRFYRHIDPKLVDSVWTSERTGSSFNLGIPALTLVEQMALIESSELGALPRLRVVVLEPILSTTLDPRNLATARVVAEHSPSGTWRILRHLASGRSTLRRRLWYGGLHLAGLGLNLFWIPELEAIAEPPATPYLPTAGAGFMAAGGGTNREAADPNLGFLRSGVFDDAVATREHFVVQGPVLPDVQLDAILEGVARVRQRGWRPVLVVTPRLDWEVRGPRPILNQTELHALRRSLQSVDVPSLLYYDDDEFLRADLWFDSGHMNERGAQLFSRRLARDLSQLAPVR